MKQNILGKINFKILSYWQALTINSKILPKCGYTNQTPGDHELFYEMKPVEMYSKGLGNVNKAFFNRRFCGSPQYINWRITPLGRDPGSLLADFAVPAQNYKWQNRKLRCIYRLYLKVQ